MRKIKLILFLILLLIAAGMSSSYNSVTSGNTSLSIWDNESQAMETYSIALFTANYTNITNSTIITGASCNISFNDSANAMTGAGPYTHTRYFSTPGNYTYNVSCAAAGYPTLNVSDWILAQDTTPPIEPVLWPTASYVSGTNVDIIGYVNEGNANISVIVYDLANSRVKPTLSQSSAAESIFYENFVTYTSKSAGENNLILSNGNYSELIVGRFLQIEGYPLDYFQRYNITGVEDFGTYKKVNISPTLKDDIPSSNAVNILSEEYYGGWFNISTSLFQGVNNTIEIWAKDKYGNERVSPKTISIISNTTTNLSYSNFDDALTSDFDLLDVSNLTDPYLGVAAKGQINFSGTYINIEGYDLDTYINIDNNYIFLNSTALPNLNSTAIITFFNLNYTTYPVIYEDGSICSDCSVLTYNASTGTLVFNVSHFSNYTSGNNSQLEISTSGTYLTGQITTFIANYTNSSDDSAITGGVCNLTLENSSSYNMTEGGGLYTYNITFSNATTVSYNISCNHSSFEYLSVSDSITITDAFLQAPILWVLPSLTINPTVQVIGYTNTSNVTAKVFTVGMPFYENTTTITTNVTLYGHSSIYNTTSNNSMILVPYPDRNYFSAGRYVYFSGHNRTYFYGYNITSTTDAPDNSYTAVYISPDLESSVSIGESLWVTNSSLPLGWFNLSLNLFAGNNEIRALVNDSFGTQSANSAPQNIFFYNGTPTFNLSGISNITGSESTTLDFSIFDSYGLNLSSMLLNITNSSGNSSYYAYNSSGFNLTIDGNITCAGSVNSSNCSVTPGFTHGIFNLTFSVKNLIGNTGTSSITNYIADLQNPLPVANLSLGGLVTSSKYWNITWNASSALSGIAYYEYAIGTSAGSNITYGWNSTNLTNVYVGPLSLTSNTEYYVSVRAVSNANQTGNLSYETIIFFDNTGPIVENVSQPLIFTNNDAYLDVNWDAYDDESEITSFDITVSKNEYYPLQNQSNIVAAKNVGGALRSDSVYFTLEHDTTYYTYIYGNNLITSSDTPGFTTTGTTFDATPPTNISLDYPSGGIQTNQLTIDVGFGYDDTSGIRKYILDVATYTYSNGVCVGIASYQTYYEEIISNSSNPKFINSSGSDTVNFTLQTGYCYQFRLRVQNNAGSFNTTYSSSGGGDTPIGNVSIDTTPPTNFAVYDTVGSVGEMGLFTLSGDSLTITWDESFDMESGLTRYELWMTEESWGMEEQPFGGYTEGNPLNLTSSNLTYYVPGIYKYTLNNLNLNLSNTSDPTHQYRYRAYIKAVNGQNLTTTNNSDGIIYIDNEGPTISILYVENESQTTAPFYDSSDDGNTTIVISGEDGMSCVWSDVDEGYKEIPTNGGNCTVTGSNATCIIPETTDGGYFYHISCKDQNGNKNTALFNIDLYVVLDSSAPVVNIIKPSETNFSDNVYVEGSTIKYRGSGITFDFNATDYSLTSARVIIRNSTGSAIINDTITGFSIQGNIYYFNYTWNVSVSDYETYNLTVYAYDYFNRTSNDTMTFIYDNTTPAITITMNDSYNASFNITLTGEYARNITWNITPTNNLSNSLYSSGVNYSELNTSINITDYINISTWSDDNYTINVWYVNDFNNTGTITKTFIVDQTPPNITITKPNATNLSAGIYVEGSLIKYNTGTINFNFTIEDYTLNNVWLQINSSSGIVVSENLTLPTQVNGTYNFSYLWNVTGNDYEAYTLTIFANDSFSLTTNESFSFVYDNSTPTLDLVMGSTFNESFNITFSGSYVRNITWNITSTSNLSSIADSGSRNYSSLNTSFSFKEFINISNMSDGNYTITAWYINDFNDTGIVSRTFVIDTSAPTINAPTYYLNEDYLFEDNTTNQVLGYNFTVLGFGPSYVLLDVNGTDTYSLSEGVPFTLTDYSNITVEVLKLYAVNSSDYSHSKAILRISNESVSIPFNYNVNTEDAFFDNNISLTLYTGSELNVNFSVDELSNHSVYYYIYDKGSPDDIHFQGALSPVDSNSSQYKYSIYKNLSESPVSLTYGWEFTLNVTVTDDYGYESSMIFNFTFVEPSPSITSVNITNNTITRGGNNIIFNSDFNLSLICSNSGNAFIDIFSGSSNTASYTASGSGGTIGLNASINTSVGSLGKTLDVLCINDLNQGTFTSYTLVFDNQTPYVEFVNPIAQSNNEFYITEVSNVSFNTTTIYVRNITTDSAWFAVASTEYKPVNFTSTAIFFGIYEIRLLDTYYDSVGNNRSIASFRVNSSEPEKTYPTNMGNYSINASGDAIYINGTMRIPFAFDDLSLDYSSNLTLNGSVIRLSDSKALYNITSFTNITTANYSDIGNLSTISIDGSVMNLTEIGQYQIVVTLTDALNQSASATFNFSVENKDPYFTSPDSSFNNTEILNKEDFFRWLSAADPDGDEANLTYGIKDKSSEINATIITYNNNTYAKISAANTSYAGPAWIILNVSDALGGYNESINFTLNITDSIGPLTINFNTSEKIYTSTGLNVSIINNSGTSISFSANYLSTINTAIPISLNTTIFDLYFKFYTLNLAQVWIFLDNLNISQQQELNITYQAFNKSLINEPLFENNNYNILDAYIFRIDNNTYSGNYTVIWEYDDYNITAYNATNFLSIFKFDINLTNNNITYNTSVMAGGISVNASSGLIWGTFTNFSLFVLAEEKPTAEVCGNGIDEDHDGSDATCPSSPSSPGSSSSSSSGGFGPTSSCTDDEKNGDETGPDCGGTCGGYWYDGKCNDNPWVNTCYDGTQNGDEEGADCGGSCSSSCPDEEQPAVFGTCYDGIQNQNEEDADCGGVCEPCESGETCSDGIQNQDETGPDCGGTCNECEKTMFGTLLGGLSGILGYILGGLLLIGIAIGFVLAAKKYSHSYDYKMPAAPAEAIMPPQDIEQPDIVKIEPGEEPPKTDLDTMIKFINEEQGKGTLNSKVKVSLLQAGWPQELIEEAFERTECARKLKELDQYIKLAKAHGQDDELIRHNLLKGNWAEHFIDMVLHEVHVLHDDFRKVEEFGKTMLSKGYSKDDVIKALTNVGWQKADIEPYISGESE